MKALLCMRVNDYLDRLVTNPQGQIPYFDSSHIAYQRAADYGLDKACAVEIYDLDAAKECHGEALTPWKAGMLLVEPISGQLTQVRGSPALRG